MVIGALRELAELMRPAADTVPDTVPDTPGAAAGPEPVPSGAVPGGAVPGGAVPSASEQLKAAELVLPHLLRLAVLTRLQTGNPNPKRNPKPNPQPNPNLPSMAASGWMVMRSMSE